MSTKSKLELRLYTCQISSILMKCMPEFSFICLLKKRTFYGLLLTFELAMQYKTYHNGKLALENLVSHANQYSDVHKAYDMMQRQDPRSLAYI